MTAPVLQIPIKVLRSATAGRRPGDGTFRALMDGELFVNTQDKVLCFLDGAGTLVVFPLDPSVLATLAPLASPAFAGTPTAPTPAAGDGSTRLATTAYADSAVAAIGKRTAVYDASYAVAVADRLVSVTAISAPRTITLQRASAVPAGFGLRIADESGSVSAANTLTVSVAPAPQGGTADAIDGAASLVMSTPYGDVLLVSDGAGKWTHDVRGVPRGGTGATTAAGARASLGAAASGANGDISSLSGLTTALSVAQGGTGVASVSALLQALGLQGSFGSTNGYVLVPTWNSGSLILNWGMNNVNSAGALGIGFGVAFPNQILSYGANPIGFSGNTMGGASITNPSKAQMQVNMTFSSGGSTGACNGNQFSWWAIGY